MKQAVMYCRDHDILREFLEENGPAAISIYQKYSIYRAYGREKRDEEIARKMIVDGELIEKVTRYTGLDIETIKNLRIEERQG